MLNNDNNKTAEPGYDLLSLTRKLRFHELSLLKAAYRKACEGRFEIVTVKGREGFGKSILVETFIQDYEKRHICIEFSRNEIDLLNQLKGLLEIVEGYLNKQPQLEIELIKERIHALSLKGSQLCHISRQFIHYFFSDPGEVKLDLDALTQEIILLFECITDSESVLILNIKCGEYISPLMAKLVCVLFQQKNLHVLCVISICSTQLHFKGVAFLLRSLAEIQIHQHQSYVQIQLQAFSEPLVAHAFTSLLGNVENLTQLSGHVLSVSDGIPDKVVRYMCFLLSCRVLYRSQATGKWTWDKVKLGAFKIFNGSKLDYNQLLSYLTSDQHKVLNFVATAGYDVPVSLIQAFLKKESTDTDNVSSELNALVNTELCVYYSLKGEKHIGIKSIESKNQILNRLSTEDMFRYRLMHLDFIFSNETKTMTVWMVYAAADQTLCDFGNKMVDTPFLLRTLFYAGLYALSISDFSHASAYLGCAYGQLTDELWFACHGLSVAIGLAYLKCAVKLSDDILVENTSNELVVRVKSFDRYLELAELILIYYKNKERHEEAIEFARTILKKLKFSLPRSLLKARAAFYFGLCRVYLLFVKEDYFFERTVSLNKRFKAVTRILEIIGPSGYMVQPELRIYIEMKALFGSFYRGVTQHFAQNLCLFGVTNLALFLDVNKGNRFYEIAKKLIRKNKGFFTGESKVDYYYNAFIRPWSQSLITCEKGLQEVLKQFKLEDDDQYAAFASCTYFCTAIMRGADLRDLEEFISVQYPEVEQFNQGAQIHIHQMVWQTIRNLLNQENNPWGMEGSKYQESRHETYHAQLYCKTVSFAYYLLKVFMAALKGNHLEVNHFFNLSKRCLDAGVGLPYTLQLYLYHSVALRCLYQKKSLKKFFVLPVLLFRNWRFYKAAKHNSEFLHFYLYNKAEMLRLMPGFKKRAYSFYLKAKEAALKSGCKPLYAFYTEHLASLHKALRLDEAHYIHLLEDSIEAYSEAGYLLKSQQLQENLKKSGYYRNKVFRQNQALSEVEFCNAIRDLHTVRQPAGIIRSCLQTMMQQLGAVKGAGVLWDGMRFVLISQQDEKGRISMPDIELACCDAFNREISEHFLLTLEDMQVLEGVYFKDSDEKNVIYAFALKADCLMVGCLLLQFPAREVSFSQSVCSRVRLLCEETAHCLEKERLHRRKKEVADLKMTDTSDIASIHHEIKTSINTFDNALEHLAQAYSIPASDENYAKAKNACEQMIQAASESMEEIMDLGKSPTGLAHSKR